MHEKSFLGLKLGLEQIFRSGLGLDLRSVHVHAQSSVTIKNRTLAQINVKPFWFNFKKIPGIIFLFCVILLGNFFVEYF